MKTSSGSSSGSGSSNHPTIGAQMQTQDQDVEKQTTPLAKNPHQGLDDIPDGGYGWLVVVACFILNFSTWGANSGFAIYLSTYLNEGTFRGATKYDYAVIGGMTFGLGLCFAPAVNFLQGKVGIKGVIVIGLLCQFAGLLMASFSTRLWELYLTQGTLQAFGLAFMTMPALSILAQWFKKKRTFAGGIASAGLGVGGLVFNLGMQKIVETRSVHWALRAQSIMCFGLTWVAIVLIRTRMEVKLSFFDGKVLRCAGFYLCVFYIIFCMFGYVVVLYDMANVTTSMGYTPYQGSISSAMVQVGSIFGRPLVGMFADRYGAVTVAGLTYFLAGVWVFGLWVPAHNYGMIIAFCLVEGGLMGAVFGTIAPILAQNFGLKRVNVSLCMLWTFLGMAGIASPVIGLSLKTGSGGLVSPQQYLDCSYFSGASFFACSLSLLVMRGYLIYRSSIAHVDPDKGLLDVHVPIWEPFKCAFKPVRGI